MEDTVGRKSVKAWNEVTVEITKMGEQLLWVSTNFAAVAKFLVQNISLIVSSGFVLFLASASTQGNILSAVFARLEISGAALQTVLLGPVGLVAGLGALIIVMAKVRQAAHDSQVAIIDEHRNAYESLLKNQQAAGAKRIEDTKREHRERTKITADYITSLSSQFNTINSIVTSEFSAIEDVAKSKLKSISSELESIFKDLATAGTKADKAMETSIQEVARTKQLIDDSAFERSVRYMTEEQKLVQQMMRAQKTALEAEKEYRDAAGNEELAKLAREKSVLAEKQLAEAKSTAESIRNSKEGYAAKQQAAYKLDEIEWQLEKSRKKRIEAELSFQKQRAKLQEQDHRVKVAQLAEELKLLSALVEKYREVRDPRTPGDVKERDRLEGQIRSVLQSVGGKLDVADLIGVRPAIEELTRGMLGGTDQAIKSMETSWTKLSKGIESRKLTVKVAFAGADGISAKIIEGLDLPDTIDPGQLTQQNKQKAEEILAAHEKITGEISDQKEQVLTLAKSMQEWNLSVATTRDQFAGLTEAGAATLRVSKGLVLTGKEYKNQLSAAEAESRAVVEMLKTAATTGKGLTTEQRKQLALHIQSVALLAQNANFNAATKQVMAAYLNDLTEAVTKTEKLSSCESGGGTAPL
jgi:hypothetical protein